MTFYKHLRVHVALIVLLCCYVLPQAASADIIHESATMGSPGQPEGAGLLTDQFLGSRFYIADEVEVTAIGGHLMEWTSGNLFGAIVSLSSMSDLPNGWPFTSAEVVASTVFDPNVPSSDFRTPLSVTLSSGYYALIFGTGRLGSASGTGAMPYAGQSNLTTPSHILWDGSGWYNTTDEPMRFVVEGGQDPNTGEIHGLKFHDVDGNGSKDPNDPGVVGWEIYLDLNDNGQYDFGEPNAITGTDPNGYYEFTYLEPNDYIVAEIQQNDWQQTCPATSSSASAAGPTTYGDMLTPGELANIKYTIIDSPPTPPLMFSRMAVEYMPMSVVMLSEVPTSRWSYGCSATAAGMLFGYYDRNGFPNMYTGPTNGGVAPLTDLCQGDDPANPIPGSCSICATQNGFDGRITDGHVDDYWTGYGAPGPDPWEDEHTWQGCTADFMGTNQWKWDWDCDGSLLDNTDGSTTYFSYGDGSRLYDYIPPVCAGLPQTALCHGLRLFAESRGYTVVENYNQKISGFSFNDYMAEIDAGRPVLIQVTGHTMLGVGYDVSGQTVYLHDTWDNTKHTMMWGDSYAGMDHVAVTVIQLQTSEENDGTYTVNLTAGEIVEGINFGNQYQPTSQHNECPDAVVVDYGVSYSDSTSDSTGTDITTCTDNDAKDVWHRFTPSVTGRYLVSLQGSGYDTSLAVFDDCGGTELACNDDYYDLQSRVIVDLAIGEVYYIRVSGYDGDMGSYTLTVALAADIDKDGLVNVTDLHLLSMDWLLDVMSDTDIAPVYGDSFVDLSDYTNFAKYWLTDLMP